MVSQFLQKLYVDIPVQFSGPASKLSCADRGVASNSLDFVPLCVSKGKIISGHVHYLLSDNAKYLKSKGLETEYSEMQSFYARHVSSYLATPIFFSPTFSFFFSLELLFSTETDDIKIFKQWEESFILQN